MGDDDADILRQFLNASDAAANEVFGWVRLGAWSFRARLRDEWEDAVSDAMVQVTEALRNDRWTGAGPLEAYVRRIAATTCLDRIRHRRRWRLTGLEDTDLPPVNRSPADLVEAADVWRLSRMVLARLPDDCVELLRRVSEGLSYREMAADSDVGEGALRVRVLRCRRRAVEIRDEIERNGRVVRTPESQREPR